MCAYALEQWVQSQDVFFLIYGSITNFVLAAVVLLAVLINLFRGRLRFADYPTTGVLIAVLLIFSLMTYAWSISPLTTLATWKKGLPYILVYVVLAPLVIGSPKDFKAAIYTFIGLGGALTVLLILDWRSSGARGLALGADGIEMVGNPLALGQLGGGVAICAALLNPQGSARVLRVALWGLVVTGLGLALMSQSRGQVIGAVLVIAVCLPLSRRINNPRTFFATLVGLGIFAVIAKWTFDFFNSNSERFAFDTMFDAYQSSRTEMSLQMLGLWLDGGVVRWVVGLGGSASIHVMSHYPHVVPVEVLVEEGLIGLAIFGAAFFWVMRDLKQTWPLVRDHADARGLHACAIGLLLYNAVLMFKQGSMLISVDYFMFAIAASMWAGALRRTVREQQMMAAPVAGLAEDRGDAVAERIRQSAGYPRG